MLQWKSDYISCRCIPVGLIMKETPYWLCVALSDCRHYGDECGENASGNLLCWHQQNSEDGDDCTVARCDSVIWSVFCFYLTNVHTHRKTQAWVFTQIHTPTDDQPWRDLFVALQYRGPPTEDWHGGIYIMLWPHILFVGLSPSRCDGRTLSETLNAAAAPGTESGSKFINLKVKQKALKMK